MNDVRPRDPFRYKVGQHLRLDGCSGKEVDREGSDLSRPFADSARCFAVAEHLADRIRGWHSYLMCQKIMAKLPGRHDQGVRQFLQLRVLCLRALQRLGDVVDRVLGRALLLDEDRADRPEYEGMYYLNAKSKTKPGVRILENGSLPEPLDESEFYSGCWGAATVSFYPFNHPAGGKGVGVGLGNVIKTRDDERLSGGVSADKAFADLAEDFDL